MLLFEIGASIFCAAVLLLIQTTFFKKDVNPRAHTVRFMLFTAVQTIGGIMMIVAYYMESGNSTIL